MTRTGGWLVACALVGAACEPYRPDAAEPSPMPIDLRQAPSGGAPGQGALVEDLTASARKQAAAGDCDGSRASAEQVRHADPDYYRAFVVPDPVITRCWSGPASRPILPCGVARVEELNPLGKNHVGTCTVESSGPYDELRDNGRLIMRAGEGKPLTAFDARIPGPAGMRVGMTGGDIERQAPAYSHVRCHAFASAFQCRLSRVAEPPACGGDPGAAVYVEFERPVDLREGAEIAGDAAWRLLRTRPIIGVVLAMPC